MYCIVLSQQLIFKFAPVQARFVCFSSEKGQASSGGEYELRHSRCSWAQQSYSV